VGLSFCTRVSDAFPLRYVDELRDSILASPYLAANNLNYRFTGTRGFSVVFRREGLARVREEFPSFAPYLDAVVDERCNAFFLNPLVIGQPAGADEPPPGAEGRTAAQGDREATKELSAGAEGRTAAQGGREATKEFPAGSSPRRGRGSGGAIAPVRVAPHVDRSLRSFTLPIEPPNPLRVTVLYVEVPAGMRGGDLRLYHRLWPVGRVRPRRNLLIQFQGWLRHEVRPARLPDARPRVSLVCEHYILDEDALARIPPFTVRSMSPFERFLEAELTERKNRDPVDPGSGEA
jgi:hypothetical protein